MINKYGFLSIKNSAKIGACKKIERLLGDHTLGLQGAFFVSGEYPQRM